MTPENLITMLTQLGVEVTIAGDDLRCRAKRGILTPPLVNAIKTMKPGLLKLLVPKVALTHRVKSAAAAASKAPDPRYMLVARADALAPLAELVAKADRIAFSLKTTGLDAIKDRPRLVPIGLPNGQCYIVDVFATGGLGPLALALEQTPLVGHNLPLDVRFLVQHLEVNPTQLSCTFTASKLINAGVLQPKVYFDLEQILKRHLGVEVDKTMQKSDWSGELSQEQLIYAVRDVMHLLRLDEVLCQEAAGLGLSGVLALENDVIPVVAHMELTGVGVDRGRWEAMVEGSRKRASELKDTLWEEFSIENPNSPKQVLAALHRQGIKVKKTCAEVLAPYRDRKIVQGILEFRTTSKFVSDVGVKVLAQLDLHGDGRVRGHLNPLSAPTGRFGCSKPNLLALPKTAGVRRCIIPAPGYVFINADYAAIELRVLAAITKDQRLQQVFKDGGDPHRQTAAMMMGVSEDEVDGQARKRAKPVNFGFAYGMGPRTFTLYALANYGVQVTQMEAKNFKAAYLRAYPQVAQWQARNRRDMPLEVRTRSGRIRRFSDRKKGYNERLNTPIQGSAADGMKQALVLLHRRLPDLGARLVLTIHDEVLVETPEDAAEETRQVVVDAMVEGMARYINEVPIVVEAEVKRNWAGE